MTPFAPAETVTVVLEATATVLTVKLTEDLPTPMLTEAGTVADFELLVSLTVTADAAGLVSVTVPLEATPPATVDGLRLTDAKAAGVNTSIAAFVAVPNVAVITADVCFETGIVVTEKVAEVCPA